MKISLEFFPSKKEKEEDLIKDIIYCKNFNIDFISITNGAFGSNSTNYELLKKIKKITDLKLVAHLTSIDKKKQDIENIAHQYLEIGVKDILALRGDIGSKNKHLITNIEYNYAVDLIKDLKKIGNFNIMTASYPEKHPEAINLDKDIDNLKAKLDAGADKAITQFFFDANIYLEFVNKCRAKNINNEIIAGILPVNNIKQVIDFSAKCGTKIPKYILDILDKIDLNNINACNLAANIFIYEICKKLKNNGINNLHFFTLNKLDNINAIYNLITN